MINVFIDEFTPCLKDVKTGELVQTEVIRIKRKSFLKNIIRKMADMLTGKAFLTRMRYMPLLLKVP